MAFDNVTFFELHLDDARFGGEQAAEPAEQDEEPEDSGRRAPPMGLLVLLGIGAVLLARRMRRSDDIEVDLEAAEPITVG